MNNVQRLDTAHSDSFIEDVQRLITQKQTGKKKFEVVSEICEKYGISQETLYHRIRSYYGKGLKDVRWEYFEPSRNELLNLIQECDGPQELRSKLNMPSRQYKGIYDRVLGVSTFQKAKLLTLDDYEVVKHTAFSPSPKDCIAMVAASRLGDSNFQSRSGNHSMRMEHCIDQLGWVEKKRELFTKAFSWMKKSSDVKVTSRNTAYWYAGTFTSKKYNSLISKPKEDMVRYLTPFGIWMLFLDDGSYTRSPCVISFAVENIEIANNLSSHLKTYGYEFKVENEHTVTLKRQYDVKRFMKDFCEPFEEFTPSCMEYKTKFESE